MGIATILKGGSLHFRCSLIFFFFFLGAIGSFKNLKTFHVKAFFRFLKEIHNFGSQGRTGLGRNAVVYILLYGLIYFFLLCKSAGRFFFSGANSDLFILFCCCCSLIYICCRFKHWRPENFPLWSLRLSCQQKDSWENWIKRMVFICILQ